MTRYVALLRAVNVAGHARLETAELARLFAAAGARDVASFGHAGNLLFSAQRGVPALIARYRDELLRRHGERPVVVVRGAAEIATLASAEPFAARPAAPSAKHNVSVQARPPPRALPAGRCRRARRAPRRAPGRRPPSRAP